MYKWELNVKISRLPFSDHLTISRCWLLGYNNIDRYLAYIVVGIVYIGYQKIIYVTFIYISYVYNSHKLVYMFIGWVRPVVTQFNISFYEPSTFQNVTVWVEITCSIDSELCCVYTLFKCCIKYYMKRLLQQCK